MLPSPLPAPPCLPGTSYGLTQQLFNFWRKAGYQPLYLRQSSSDVTGEHTCVMVQPLEHPDVADTNWVMPFVKDFKVRRGWVGGWVMIPSSFKVRRGWVAGGAMILFFTSCPPLPGLI